MVSITQLHYIVQVFNLGSYQKAAKAMDVTQPTLSMQIKKAENTLGVQIFDRRNSPIVLTPIGHKIVEQARIVIEEHNKIKWLVEKGKGKLEGKVNIGIIPTISTFLIPKVWGRIKSELSELEIHFVELKTEHILDQLKKNEIDFGIMAGPFDKSSLTTISLGYEPMYVYAAGEQFKGPKVNTQDLKGAQPWLLTEGNCFRSQMMNLCKIREKSIQQRNWFYEGGSIETLIRLVDQEGGFTLIPGLAADLLKLEEDHIRYWADANPVRELIIVHRKRYAKTGVVEAIKEVIQSSFPEAYLKSEGKDIIEWV